MNIKEECKVSNASNYPEQKLLNEIELLAHLERHYTGNPATRIYVAPRCYIIPDFFEYALHGMLRSFEEKEEYEVCARVYRLIKSIRRKQTYAIAFSCLPPVCPLCDGRTDLLTN